MWHGKAAARTDTTIQTMDNAAVPHASLLFKVPGRISRRKREADILAVPRLAIKRRVLAYSVY